MSDANTLRTLHGSVSRNPRTRELVCSCGGQAVLRAGLYTCVVCLASTSTLADLVAKGDSK